MRLFWWFLLSMLVAALVPTSIVGLTSVVRTRELLVRDAQELAGERVKQVRLKTEYLLEEPLRSATSLSRIPGFLQLPLAEQRSHLASLLKMRRDITIITVFDEKGHRVPGLQGFAVGDVPPSAVAQHEARAEALLAATPRSPDVAWGEPLLPPGKSGSVTAIFPVDEVTRGAVAVEVSLAGFDESVGDERFGSSGFAYLVDGRGRLLAGPENLGQRGADLSARPVVADLRRTFGTGTEAFRVGNFGEGEGRVVGAYTLLGATGWAVVSEQPMDMAYAQVRAMERRLAFWAGAALLVALVLATVFSRTLAQPLRKFGTAALEIAKGRFGVQFDYRARNELGELAQTFNYMSAQIEAYDHETKRLYESLEKGYLETIVALANSIDSKDPYTRGHSMRVGDMAMEIGREMGLTPRELKALQFGGILHDIGKIGIVDSILCKQSRLTDEEMVVMREHPAIGDSIVQPVTFLSSARAAVRSHHERWDGTGYPDRLKGDAIPLIARIIGCADTFDACTSTRPYQKALSLEKTMEIIEGLRGTQLDPRVVDALRRVLEKKGANVRPSGSVQLAS